MKILNLGCGVKTSNHPDVINIDWSFYLRFKRSFILRSACLLFLRGVRLERFKSLPSNILVHDLSKGIPFADDSVDVVYHSHMLEHLDRDVAIKFLKEAKRVLKSSGIHRIVVPDFELLSNKYLGHITKADFNLEELENHDEYIAAMIEQSVRKEARGISQRASVMRLLEKILIGDARRRGETHQWMYDRINLKAKLLTVGYKDTQVHAYNTSSIRNWNDFGLDFDRDGNPHKKNSLYLEAKK